MKDTTQKYKLITDGSKIISELNKLGYAVKADYPLYEGSLSMIVAFAKELADIKELIVKEN